MALFDKLKDAKNKAADAVTQAKEKVAETAAQSKEWLEGTKVELEQKKAEAAAERERIRAEKEAHQKEMLALCEERRDAIIARIDENYADDLDGFFSGKTKEDVFKYVKSFFENILLPGNSRDQSRIMMYPYISDKQMTPIRKTFGEFIDKSGIVFYVSDTEGQEFLLTYGMLYFKSKLPEDKEFFIKGEIPTEKIRMLSVRKESDFYSLCCDDVELAKINIYTKSIFDFVTLDKFFQDMKNGDFEITPEEVHETISRKIGSEVTAELSGYYDDDSEKLIFFTWNSDGGYVALTNVHIIVANKQSGGNVSNISSFYYDEITNLQIHQDKADMGTASSSSLGGFLLETAANAVMESAIDSLMKEVCDLKLTANGRFITLHGLRKVEADRITVLYNQFRKEIHQENRIQKAQQGQPIVIQQQSVQVDIVEQIKKLNELKEMGILSDEEFSAKKADLLAKM